MVTKEGIITGRRGNRVWVKTVRSKSCDACASRDSCEEASRTNEMTVQLENSLNASPGDRVLVGFETAPLLKVTFLLYIFPIIMLVAGIIAGEVIATKINTEPSLTSIVLGFAGFFVSFLIIRFVNKNWAQKKEFQPYLLRFAGNNEKCDFSSN